MENAGSVPGHAARLAAIRERIGEAVKRAGREPGSVRLVAVGKTFPVPALQALRDAGVTDFGENRVQEAEAKAGRIGGGVTWHLVGHLQANKARRAADVFDWVHSLDSDRVAHRLSDAAVEGGRIVTALVQVDLTEQPGRHGVPPADLRALLRTIRDLPGVRLRGLMVLPAAGDPVSARPSFRRLAELAAEISAEGLLPQPVDLSMGMSGDFEVAIEEGATLVRIGAALFGGRPGLPD